MSIVADKPGVYRSFTGAIRWKKTDCKVRDASFELLDEPKRFKGRTNIYIMFERGLVTDGTFFGVNIKECDFRGYKVFHSVFHSGIFDGFIFDDSHWLDGTWKRGHWSGGYDKFNRFRMFPPVDWDIKEKTINTRRATYDGVYHNFTGTIEFGDNSFKVKNADFDLRLRYGADNELEDDKDEIYMYCGELLSGGCHQLIATNCKIRGGTWCEATFQGCDCYGGLIDDSHWEDGTWHDGIWRDSYWESGTWHGGVWESGFWIQGYDKDGNFHSENDSPDKWDL